MIVIDKQLCDHCGTCVAVCEPDAIDLYYKDIHVDTQKCVECLRCIWVCPIGVPKQVNKKASAGKS